MSGQGAAIGAATGATYALATGEDPVKYAMIGGAVGGAGPGAASALGLGGTAAGTTAATTAGTSSALTGAGASTAANTAFMAPAGVNPATVINASQAAPVSAMGTTPGIFSNFTSPVPTPSNAVPRDIGFLESTFNPNIQSSSMAPSFMEQVGSGAGQVGQFAQENPYLTQMGIQSAQQMMRRPEVPTAPAAQISRGQIQPMDYMSLLSPQQSTVLRPQPISLLG
jgi:hypothetical protein